MIGFQFIADHHIPVEYVAISYLHAAFSHYTILRSLNVDIHMSIHFTVLMHLLIWSDRTMHPNANHRSPSLKALPRRSPQTSPTVHASPLRPWTKIPLQILSQQTSLHPGLAQMRMHSSKAGADTSRAAERADPARRPMLRIDRDWNTQELARQASEALLLHSLLDGSAHGQSKFYRKKTAEDSGHVQYWWTIVTTAKQSRPKQDEDSNSGLGAHLRAEASKQLRELHVNMTEEAADFCVDRDCYRVRNSFFNLREHLLKETVDDLKPKVAKCGLKETVEKKIVELEARLAFEKECSPLEPPGDFSTWRGATESLKPMNRVTIRRLWGRNNSMSGHAKRSEAHREAIAKEWKVEILQLESTLAMFKEALIRLETDQDSQSEERLDGDALEQLDHVLPDESREDSQPVWPEPILSTISLADQLKADLSSTQGEVVIDDTMTVYFDAEVPELQGQVFYLSRKLKVAYPLMDTLPYNVWTSDNRVTLQTWLKILVRKWQTRDEGVSESAAPRADVSQDVRILLDQMVLDHQLEKEAAERMVNRWTMVFREREARKSSPEPTTHEEEDVDFEEPWDAGFEWMRIERELPAKSESNQKRTTNNRVYRPWDKKSIFPIVGSDDSLTAKRKVAPSERVYAYDIENSRRNKTKGIQRKYSVFQDRRAAHPRRYYSTSQRKPADLETEHSTKSAPAVPEDAKASTSPEPTLPHLTPSGSAHMVSISSKAHTVRTAIAAGSVHFSNATPLSLIRSNSMKKGDVLSVSRIAGIMAAKKCPDLIPLCHPIMLTHVGVELSVFDGDDGGFGGVTVEAKVQCEGQTGVEMEALTSVMATALSVVDMCKAVDKGMSVQNVRVVLKEGGRSGTWKEEGWKSALETSK